MAITSKDFERQFGELLNRIQQNATPFPHDTIERRVARVKRASVDKFFFAATYFPHYIEIDEEYRECWKDPDGQYDWVKAGFSPIHADFFRYANQLDIFTILAAFRESAKDTLLGKIDPVHKLLADDKQLMRWFIPVVAMTQAKSEGKIIPIKLEIESNARLRSDFGDQVGMVKWETDHFVLKNGRGMKAYGREQSLRGEEIFGHRPDHIILNDVNDPTKPDSPGLVQKFIDSVKQDILKAVNSPRWSAILLCNYTVKDDIVDALMTGRYTSHYNKKIFRALVPNDLETAEDRRIAKAARTAGFPDSMKSAWETRHPTLRLLKERSDDPETFECERMMVPRSRRDQKFRDQYFRYHTRDELSGKPYVHYTFVDSSAKEANDYKSVITVGVGLRGDDVHIPIVSCSIQQQSIDEMMLETFRQKNRFNSKLVGVETNGFQILLKREYLRLQKKYGLLPFLEVEHTGESKESRIERIVPFVKNGTITFDLDDPDQELLIRQLKAFPNAGEVKQGGLGDDGPDSLAGCIELVEKYPHAGEVEYASVRKREAAFGRGAW